LEGVDFAFMDIQYLRVVVEHSPLLQFIEHSHLLNRKNRTPAAMGTVTRLKPFV
jgi:hypothetical protein